MPCLLVGAELSSSSRRTSSMAHWRALQHLSSISEGRAPSPRLDLGPIPPDRSSGGTSPADGSFRRPTLFSSGARRRLRALESDRRHRRIRLYRSRTLVISVPFRPKRPASTCGIRSSNPLSSTGESPNLRFLTRDPGHCRAHRQAGPVAVQPQLPPPAHLLGCRTAAGAPALRPLHDTGRWSSPQPLTLNRAGVA
jgi:hypothetical protein